MVSHDKIEEMAGRMAERYGFKLSLPPEPQTQSQAPREYSKRPRSRGISKAIRQKVFKRDHYTCQICRQRFPEQHLVPNHKDHNIRHNKMGDLETTCAGCNMQEGMIYAKLLREAGPRDQISEEKRLRIVSEARRITREQAPHKGNKLSSNVKAYAGTSRAP